MIERILEEVMQERERQDRLWGPLSDNLHPPLYWLAILTEEVGEVAQAIIQHDSDKHNSYMRIELVQVAAVAIKWLEAMEEEGTC